MYGIHLARLPSSAKVFCTLFLVGIGAGTLAAATQAATAMGCPRPTFRRAWLPRCR